MYFYNVAATALTLLATVWVVDATPSGYACVPPDDTLPFCNTALNHSARVADLLARLNVTEKIGLMGSQPNSNVCNTLDAGVPRLGIPPFMWLVEVNSGVSTTCYSDAGSTWCPTIFPSPLNLGASFNRTLWAAKGTIVSDELRAFSNLNTPRPYGAQYLVSVSGYGPNINIVIDPRYGRTGELVSEDPLLSGVYAAEYMRTLQNGPDPVYAKMIAGVKHFAYYNIETNRFGLDVSVSAFDSWDTHLPAFQAAFIVGGAAGAMCSYASVNGIPSCGSDYLLNQVARGFWGATSSVITSDCGAVSSMVNANHYATNASDASTKALHAGVTIEDGNTMTGGGLAAALAAGTVSIDDVDAALTLSLLARMSAGAFDPVDGQMYTTYDTQQIATPAALQAQYEGAVQGIVLLQNNNSTLPLMLNAASVVAVVGPHANYTRGLMGDYYEDDVCPGADRNTDCVPTIYSALAAVGARVGAVVNAAPGVDINSTNATGIPAAMDAVASANVVLLCLGLDQTIEHEGIDRPDTALPGLQTAFALQVLANASARGVPVVLILLNAGAVAFDSIAAAPAAIIEAFYPGFGAPALVSLMTGAENRWGRMPYTLLPASFADAIPITNMNMTAFPGRTYKYYTGVPLFPFGWGLSYTDTLVQCSSDVPSGPYTPSFAFVLNCSVTHVSGPAGDEILLVYHRVGVNVRSLIGNAHPVPALSLVDFDRVHVPIGGMVNVSFRISATSLGLVNATGASVVYPGAHFIDVSPRPSSDGSGWQNVSTAVPWGSAAPVALQVPPIPPPVPM